MFLTLKPTVDGKSWYPQDRTFDLNKFRLVTAIPFGNDHPSCNRQVTIKPRMPYASSVSFHSDLKISGFAAFRDGTDL